MIQAATGEYYKNINIHNENIELQGGYSSDSPSYDRNQFVSIIDGERGGALCLYKIYALSLPPLIKVMGG